MDGPLCDFQAWWLTYFGECFSQLHSCVVGMFVCVRSNAVSCLCVFLRLDGSPLGVVFDLQPFHECCFLQVH